MSCLKHEDENPLFSNPPDLVDKISEKIDSFSQSLENKYWLRNLNPNKDYIERDFDILVELVDVNSGEQFEAFISRVPARVGGIDDVMSFGERSHFGGDGMGRQFNELVFRSIDEFADDPKWFPIPSTVWLKRLDDGPDGFRKFVYYSPSLAAFKCTVAPRSWEIKRATTGNIEINASGDNLIEGFADENDQSFDTLNNFNRYFLTGDNDLHEALSALEIKLAHDGADVTFEPSSDCSIKIGGVFFGPFDYGRSLIKGGRQKIVHQQTPASSEPSLRHISLQALKAA